MIMMKTGTLYQQNWLNWYRYIFKIMIEEHLSMNGQVKSINPSVFFKKKNYFPDDIRGSERHSLREEIQRSK